MCHLEPDKWYSLNGVLSTIIASLKVLARSIESNIFSALGGIIFPLFSQLPNTPPGLLPQLSQEVLQASTGFAETVSGSSLEEGFHRKPLDLWVGSTFYNQTVCCLHQAVATLPVIEQDQAFPITNRTMVVQEPQ